MTPAELMMHYGLSVPFVAARLNREPSDVQAWCDGMLDPPPYLEHALRAVKNGHRPATPDRMDQIERLDLMVGVQAAQANYWKRADQYPMAARMAVAAIDAETRKLSQYDIATLGRIIRAGCYYRRPGGWHARHVMGKPMRKIKLHTIDNLRRLGLVTVNGDTLTATKKGRERWFVR